MIMREKFPSLPVRAIVLPHGPPLPLAEIRSPPLPVRLALARRLQPLFLFREFFAHVGQSFRSPKILSMLAQECNTDDKCFQ